MKLLVYTRCPNSIVTDSSELGTLLTWLPNCQLFKMVSWLLDVALTFEDRGCGVGWPLVMRVRA